jgi:hypothetical protein
LYSEAHADIAKLSATLLLDTVEQFTNTKRYLQPPHAANSDVATNKVVICSIVVAAVYSYKRHMILTSACLLH